MTQNHEEGMEEVKSITIKLGKVGDFFKGTLVNIQELDVKDFNTGVLVRKKLYKFKGIAGTFHDMDPNTFIPLDPAIEVEPGKIYVLWSRGKRFMDNMLSVKLGQICMIKYVTDGKPAKGKRAAKIVKILTGAMDETFVNEEVVETHEEEVPENEMPPI